tara:strand:- start:158 stop:709 length:552 start_codon:yes stop_codon:yes gene_type:complete
MFLKIINSLSITFTLIFMILQNTHASNLYDLSFNSIDGDKIHLSDFQNKVILIVNTASFCGFTRQYYGLQELWEKYQEKDFVLIGFPSDDFGQEANTNSKVKKICEIDFSINFLIAEISNIRGENTNQVFKFLRESLGRNSIPKWNFYKYIINKKGEPVQWYASLTNPKNRSLINEIDRQLSY